MVILGSVVSLILAAPATSQAGRPRISEKQFRFVVLSKPYEPYRLYVEAKFRVCDDSAGGLRAIVRQQAAYPDQPPHASAGFAKILPAPSGCRRYRMLWRVTDQFFGIGWYVVNVRVRDSEGLLSNAVGRAWFTRD